MKLKACPFCGEEKELGEVATDHFDEWSDIVVRCSNCGAKGPPCSTLSKAVECWNTRKKGGE